MRDESKNNRSFFLHKQKKLVENGR